MDIVEAGVAVREQGELAGLSIVRVDVDGTSAKTRLVLSFDEAHVGR